MAVAAPVATVKEEARQMVERLPDDATWEDVQYRICVRQSIKAGMADSRAGRGVSHEEAKRRFGLSQQP